MSTFDIGLFNNSYTVTDAVSLASPDDLYNFTLASGGGLQASFTGMSSPLNWQVKDSGGSTLQRGLVSATNPEAINLYNLTAGNYSLQVSQAAGDTDYTLKFDPLTNFNFDSGFFTVEQRGQVSFDFVIDGGWYEGELAIFSMKEIDKFNPNSEAFIKETTRRALTNSTEGYVVISDPTEGAKLTSNFALDGNFNAGEYKGIKTFAMTPGDKFGVLMVPNGTVQEVFNNPSIGGDKRPLFSLATANPNDAFHVGQIADVTKDSKTFAMEDIRYDLGSDKDYNDFIFRVTGARGVAIGLDEVIDPKKDWRNTTVGEDLRKYINTPPQLLQFNLNSIYQVGETINITNAKVFDENRDVTKVIFTLKKPDGSKVSNEINNFTFNEDWASFNYGLSNLAAGNYELEAIAHDKLEQTSTPFNLKFTVNAPVVVPPNTAPQSLQFTILPSYSLGETVNLMGGKVYDVNSSSDLNKVDFQLQKDGGGWQDISDVNTFNNDSGDSGWGNFNYSLMGLDAGSYQLKAITYDKSGAFSNEVVQNFIVNPPVVLPSNTAPESLQFSVLPLYTNEEKISFNGAKVYDSDGVGDIHKVDFWLRHPDGTWFDIADVTQFTADSKGRGRFNYSYDLSGLAPGRYQLWGIANDKSYNYSQPFFQNFSVITDSGTGRFSDDVRLAAAEAANLDNYDPQALAQTREWVVWVTPGRSSAELASQVGAQDIGATGQIPNTYIWKFPDTIAPTDVANLFGRLNGVEFAYPEVPVDLKLLYQPGDPLFSEQWNLQQANVPAAWDIISPVTSQPVRGRNAVIAIVDDGIAYQHSELQGRYNPALSWDFSDNDSDPAPTSNVMFNGDFSSPNTNLMDMTLTMPVNLTGMVTDVNVKFNVKNSLPADLPPPTDLDVYLYSPDQSADDPGTWFNPNRPGRWPGSDDLKFAQKVQLFIREDGSVEFDRNKLKGSYAGGIWKLEIQNPDPNTYNREQLERIGKELFNSWSLQVQTLNPHGTAVAGIAGATENNTGIVGVAPQAQLAGLRLLGNIDQFTGTYKSTGNLIADALFQTIPRPNQFNRNQFIDIFNNSWGPEYVNRQPLALAALGNGVNIGRNGRGNNYVFAAGNDGYWGGNVNYNSFANSRHAIAVAAIGNNNIRAPYSSQGASVLVSAYSDNGKPKNDGFVGITTTSITRKNGYAGDFGGTSAAAPFVSGEIALMLEANRNLTSRDVQHILVKTAQPIDVVRDSLGNIQASNGWTKNQAGYWFNNNYGFGAIDVPKAVTTAANWTTVEAESRFESAQELVGDEIPNGVGELEPSIIKVDQDITIEKVEVLLDVQHQNWADLKVVLTSPDGTQSVLAEPILDNNARFKPNLKWWTLTSVRHWGESSKGDWKLQVFDRKGNEFTGNWESWKLNVYGTKPTVSINATDANATESGDPGQFTVTRSGNTKYALTVNYSLAGNATNGTDYDALSGTVVIPAGQSTVTIPIRPIDDGVSEGNEAVVVNLTASNAYAMGINNSGRVAIADNETSPALFTDIGASLTNIAFGSVDWGDYDNDGDLDILLTGALPYSGGAVSKVYRNDNGNFIDINAPLIDVYHSSVDWGDYDNDGDLDILLMGDVYSGGYTTKVYRNDGGNFTDINASLIGARYGDVAWGDYDNDGDLDILLTGEQRDSSKISKVYRNDSGNFTDTKAPLIGVELGSVAWGDYDKDGDLDILLTGSTDSSRVSKVYRNNNGSFIDINASLKGVSFSSVAWGDYDKDGDLDILISGWDSSSKVTKLYRNDGSSFTDIDTSLMPSESVAWGDYDNDGDLDILLTASSSPNSIAKIYSNNGGGNFTDIGASIEGVSASSVVWGDYDKDGDLDILVTGDTSINDFTSKIYRNNTTIPNTAPTAPTNLNAVVNGSSITLNWNPATDAQTPQNGLTYNLRVGTTPGGSNIMSPMALGNGTRQVVQMGNVNQNTNWTLKNLQPGTYYWSVQAVDTAFAGSAFATEGSFTVEPQLNEGLQWIQRLGSSSDDESSDVAVDSSGNIYITGETFGSLGGTYAGGGRDAWVAKYNNSGILQWTKHLGTASEDDAEGVAVDNSGNVYVVGHTGGSLAEINTGGADAWIAKYDNNGNELWIKQFAASSLYNAYRDVALDNFGNVYAMGSIYTGNLYQALLNKYDSNGNLLWTRQFGTSNEDYGNDIAVDNDGNVYISGEIRFFGGSNAGSYDAWIAKYNSSGTLLWNQQLGTPSDDRASGLAVDSFGNAYMTGSTSGSLVGSNAGGRDAWIAKYNSSGNLLWTRQLGTSGSDEYSSVVTDIFNNVYVSGGTNGAIDGSNAGSFDALMAKYDSNGNLLWTKQLGTSGFEFSNGISLGNSGDVYISGRAVSSTFGGTGAGLTDAWVLKYKRA